MRRWNSNFSCANKKYIKYTSYPLDLPLFWGILIETAFSNVDCKISSEALKARLFTTSVLLAATPMVENIETRWIQD